MAILQATFSNEFSSTHWGWSDEYGDHRSGSTSAQVMAWCLTPPSHYLNQCGLNMRCVLWHSPESNFTRSAQDINPQNEFQNYTIKMKMKYLSGVSELKKVLHFHSKFTEDCFWRPINMRYYKFWGPFHERFFHRNSNSIDRELILV